MKWLLLWNNYSFNFFFFFVFIMIILLLFIFYRKMRDICALFVQSRSYGTICQDKLSFLTIIFWNSRQLILFCRQFCSYAKFGSIVLLRISWIKYTICHHHLTFVISSCFDICRFEFLLLEENWLHTHISQSSNLKNIKIVLEKFA